MYSDSHKAQRNSFAHHRADLLFSIQTMFAHEGGQWPAGEQETVQSAAVRAEARRQRVRAGLLGFVSTGAAPAF